MPMQQEPQDPFEAAIRAIESANMYTLQLAHEEVALWCRLGRPKEMVLLGMDYLVQGREMPDLQFLLACQLIIQCFIG